MIKLRYESPDMPENPNWLELSDWKWVQDTLPIACCDVVPVRAGSEGRTIEQIGLIYRDTPHQGKRWCIVGGRMHRNETMAEAGGRQLRETLGPDVRFEIEPYRQPDFVVQYFPYIRPGYLLDPRQHALTMVFAVPITGQVTAMGEAESFRWFDADALPPVDQFGFEQNKVIEACLNKWKLS
jgi:ADP-ribose pyrophosphatase YjhB (NUDIX family)